MDASIIIGIVFVAAWLLAMVAINRIGLLSLAYQDHHGLRSIVTHAGDGRERYYTG